MNKSLSSRLRRRQRRLIDENGIVVEVKEVLFVCIAQKIKLKWEVV